MDPIQHLFDHIRHIQPRRPGGPGGGGGTVPQDRLRQIVLRLRALRRLFPGPGLSQKLHQTVLALAITTDPALDYAYLGLLRRRQDLAQRSVPAAAFTRLTEAKMVLASICDAAGPLSLSLLHVVTDLGQEIRDGNQRLLSTIGRPGPALQAILPGITQERLQSVFAQTREELARLARKARKRGPSSRGGAPPAAAPKARSTRSTGNRDRGLPTPAAPASPLGARSPAAGLLPLDGLKQVDGELLDLGRLLQVPQRTVTERCDPWVAYGMEQRTIAVLIATALEINPDVAPLGQALDLTPTVIQDAIWRQTDALDGHLLAHEVHSGSRAWVRVVEATLFLCRSQVRAAAMTMLSDGSLDEAGQKDLADDLLEVRTLEGWTVALQQRHQHQLQEILLLGAAAEADLRDRRKLMEVLAALRDWREPDPDDLIEAAAIYQRYLAAIEE